jgi:branched-chain amino acid transport system ATP-binding protein
MTAPSTPDKADTPTPMLQARHISKHFRGLAALSDVSLEVGQHEMIGLIGPNGAGKTTLFNCLAGVIEPDRGMVRLEGEDVLGLPPYRRALLGIGRTFQRIELFGDLTVREHLFVAVRAQRVRGGLLRDLIGRSRPSAEERAICDQTIELVGLTAEADAPAGSLPLGRGRVVELARALVGNPRLLFLDEPSSGLDHHETAEMASVLEQVHAEHDLAILLCEHDVPFVERLAARTYVLDCGLLIAEGETAEVLADPRVRRAYLGATA